MDGLFQMMDGLVEAAEFPDAPTHEIASMAQFIVAAAQGADGATLTKCAAQLAPVVDIRSPHAPVTFVLAGALVENGAESVPLGEAIVAPLGAALEETAAWLDELERTNGAITEQVWAEAELPHAWHVVDLVWRPAIAALAQRTALRDRHRHLLDAAERVGRVHDGAQWLRRLLRVLDEAPFLVVHPETSTAFELTVDGVATMRELHTHLLAELVGPGRGGLPGAPLDPAIVACVRGEGPQVVEAHAPKRWRMFTFDDEAIGPGAEPIAIPERDGRRVVVLREDGEEETYAVHRSFTTLKSTVRVTRRIETHPSAD